MGLLAKLTSKISSRHLKYVIGCAGGLSLKVVLTNLLLSLSFSLGLAYLLVHVCMLLYSFFYHSRITFSAQKTGWKHFVQFFLAVSLLKVIDYALVMVVNNAVFGFWDFEIHSVTGRVLASLIIALVGGFVFVLRYFLYKQIYAAPDPQRLAAKIRYYTGATKSVFCGYASRSECRDNAASGGIVSACMIELLDSGEVDGCLLYKLNAQGGVLQVEPVIATSKQDILDCQGSIYMHFQPLAPDVLSLLRRFPGKLAVVGLPCAIAAFRKKCAQHHDLQQKITHMIGLFCGHTSQKVLLDTILAKKGIPQEQIKSFSFRKGLWRGHAQVILNDGTTIEYPSWHFNLYQNLFVYAHRGCLQCNDHFAEEADVSVGDVWAKEFKTKEVKHSVFAARTDAGVALIDSLCDKESIRVTEVDEAFLFRANNRAAIFHKASRAKHWAGRFWNMNIKASSDSRPARLNEIIAALIFLGMYKWSMSKHAGVIFRIPSSILWVILIIAKLLTNF